MKQATAILLTLVIGLFNSAIAQLPGIKTYTIQDGLVSNNVRRIFQDSKGFIWIGTWEGLSQYNGYKFINYSVENGLSHSLVNDFIETDGKLLIALNDGSVDYIQNGWVSAFAKLPSGLSGFIKLSNKRISIPTDLSGIYEYQNGKILKPKQDLPDLGIPLLAPINDSLLLCVNQFGKIIILTRDYRVFLNTSLPNDAMTFMYIDSKKRTWICTNGGLKLLSLDARKGNLQLISPPTDLIPPVISHSEIITMQEDPEGGLWVATNKGLAHIGPDRSYNLYTEKDGLPSLFVNTIFIDREKNIWLGTTNGLAKVVSLNNISVLNTSAIHGLNDVYVVMPGKKKEIVLSTSRGPKLYRQRSNSFINIKFPGKLPPFYFVPGSNPLIFFGSTSIGYFDSIQNRVIPLKSDDFFLADYSFCVDDKGHTFFGTLNGIGIVSGKKVWINKTLNDFIPALTVDKDGFLWAGTRENGLYRIHYSFAGDSVLFEVKDFSHLVPDKFIRGLFTDKEGNVWAGTRYKGVFRLTPKKDDSYDVTAFDQKQGLSSNYIKSFAEAPNGDIWVGTLYGLNKLIKEKNCFRVFNFSRVTNFYSVIYYITYAGNNEWWCVAGNKLVKFKDQNLENVPPLKTEIVSISLGSLKNKININSTDTVISLKHSQNQANFEFSAPGFINEKQILYSYRLLGTNDTVWSVPKDVHEVSYASLQPGNYIFEVRTIGWNGKAGPVIRFRFDIRPPFWKTWWFIFSIVAVFAAFLYMLYRYRILQLQRLQQVRNRIATDLHDDIGSTLTNISILAELSRRNKEEPEKAEAYLDRISEEIDASGQVLDDIIWSVNSKNDTIQETAARMRRYAAELFDACNIRYELIMDPSIADKKIMMEQRRDLFLIFKEALNNIHKHAVASSVFISLFIEKENIALVIKDDGKGFDTSQLTHRNGISNLKERVSRWNGQINVQSGNGRGTTINVKLPLSGITQKGE